MTSSVELVPGTVVNHRYHVQRVLGRGGCGRTYLAIDRCRFNELCVLKEFVPNSQGDPVVASKLRQLFRREAAILHKLDHPQIPKFYAGFELDDRLFIVQEFIDGKTYWKQLQERRRQGETFTEREIIPWLRSLLGLLDYIHSQKIVHRDISPDNIMLSHKRNLPVLIDFGVVKQTAHSELVPHSSGLIQASVAVGKVGYAPYEQIRMGQCSPRSDLYALAVTAVVLLTGQSPHLLMNPKTLDWQWHHRVKLDRRFRQILDRMMAERPTDRYPSARAVLQDLSLLHSNSRQLSRSTPPCQSSALKGAVRSKTERAAQTQLTLLQSSMSMVPIAAQTTQIEPAASETSISQSQLTLPFSGLSVPFTDLHLLSSGQPSRIAPITTYSKIWVREKSPWFERSVSQTLMLASLLLLPIAGILVGIQSPHIAPLCEPLQNCAGLETTEQYRQAVEQAASAKTLMTQAQTLPDLQRARDRLSESLSQLSVLTANPQVQPEALNLVRQYQSVFQGLEVHLEREARAEQLLHRAAAEAQQAIEQSRTAKTPQQLKLAKRQWQKAVATLKAIPEQAFVTQQAKARSEEYLNRLKAIDLRLAAMTPGEPQAERGQELTMPQPAVAQFPTGGIGTAPVQPQIAIAQPTRTAQSSQSRPTSRSSRPTQTRRSPEPARVAARPTTSSQSPNRSVATPRYAMAASRPSQVFIWIDQASIHPDGTPIARLRIINDSDRPFSFSPVYAEVQTAENQTFRSRVLLTSTSPTILQPGESMSGSVSLLDRNWSALHPKRATLIIQERASGDRVFHIPLPINL
ncbi:serine/threonine protein kinase [Leptolyngbya ohadii]|uniref:serine/threonine protein kinase n=1 Tax=Leptolyngbya ohadii TaxID=1962290 RepID=UPI000B5986CA|nr:serine/threonine-protein kinase [Leptolyngbya ohadii]